MQQWEHTSTLVNTNYVNRYLEEYEAKGWELVTAFPHMEWIMLFFKRPIQKQQEENKENRRCR